VKVTATEFFMIDWANCIYSSNQKNDTDRRRALHKYDPPDLLQDNPAPKAAQNNDLPTSPSRKKTKTRSILDQQITDATELGLPVRFHPSSSDTQHQSDDAENGNDCWRRSEEFHNNQHCSDDLNLDSDDDLL